MYVVFNTVTIHISTVVLLTVTCFISAVSKGILYYFHRRRLNLTRLNYVSVGSANQETQLSMI